MSSGCGCKEVYIYIYFLILLTYPYSSCICSFLQQHPYFLFIKKNVFIYQWSRHSDQRAPAVSNCQLSGLLF